MAFGHHPAPALCCRQRRTRRLTPAAPADKLDPRVSPIDPKSSYYEFGPFRLDQGDVSFDAPDTFKQGVAKAIADNRTHYLPSTGIPPLRKAFADKMRKKNGIPVGSDDEILVTNGGTHGLFAAFQAGVLGLSCVLVDALDRPGGQCTELYPEKPIYDIPALPIVTGQELTNRLLEQIKPFNPQFHFSEMATALEKLADGRWKLKTDAGTEIIAPVVVIAAGAGFSGGTMALRSLPLVS